MRFCLSALLNITCLLASLYWPTVAQEGSAARRRQTSQRTTSRDNDIEKKDTERALMRLRILRDGWNDVNREFIKPNFVASGKRDHRDYEIQYLEAKLDVATAVGVLPKGELQAAIKQAIELFNDLEEIEEIFDKRSPFTTSVRVADVFPYLKKYNVPYQGGIIKTTYGLTLHQDFVMSYILPLRYARVNRIEVLMGGKAAPIPSPPTFEQMFHVPTIKPPIDRSSIDGESLKVMTRQAIEAKLKGKQPLLSDLLDSRFIFYALQGRQWDKEGFLKTVFSDQTVKGFGIESAELSFRLETPVITTVIKYESFKGEFKSRKNTFTFVNRNGKWLIATWRAF